jgi:hypothetical protein
MAYVKPDYGFDVRPQGDAQVIAYRHGKFAYSTALMIFVPAFVVAFVLVATVVAGLMRGIAVIAAPVLEGKLEIVIAVISLLAVILAAMMIQLLNRIRARERRVVVLPGFIEVRGRSYDVRHISKLFARGPQNQIHQAHESVMVGGTGLAGATAATAAFALNEGVNAIQRSVGRLKEIEGNRSGWSVCMT